MGLRRRSLSCRRSRDTAACKELVALTGRVVWVPEGVHQLVSLNRPAGAESEGRKQRPLPHTANLHWRAVLLHEQRTQQSDSQVGHLRHRLHGDSGSPGPYVPKADHLMKAGALLPTYSTTDS